MKKFVFICCLLFIAVTKSIASKADLFEYNELAVSFEMSGLQELENLINTSDRTESVNARIEKIYNELNIKAEPSTTYSGDPLYGMPAFLYGCCLGPIGVVLVYAVTSNNRDSVRQASNGCLTRFIVTGAVYIFYLYTIYNSGYSGNFNIFGI